MNYKGLIECRNKNELKEYFSQSGKILSEEEIKLLKSSFDNEKFNGCNLSLDQLKNIAGGWEIHIYKHEQFHQHEQKDATVLTEKPGACPQNLEKKPLIPTSSKPNLLPTSPSSEKTISSSFPGSESEQVELVDKVPSVKSFYVELIDSDLVASVFNDEKNHEFKFVDRTNESSSDIDSTKVEAKIPSSSPLVKPTHERFIDLTPEHQEHLYQIREALNGKFFCGLKDFYYSKQEDPIKDGIELEFVRALSNVIEERSYYHDEIVTKEEFSKKLGSALLLYSYTIDRNGLKMSCSIDAKLLQRLTQKGHHNCLDSTRGFTAFNEDLKVQRQKYVAAIFDIGDKDVLVFLDGVDKDVISKYKNKITELSNLVDEYYKEVFDPSLYNIESLEKEFEEFEEKGPSEDYSDSTVNIAKITMLQNIVKAMEAQQSSVRVDNLIDFKKKLIEYYEKLVKEREAYIVTCQKETLPVVKQEEEELLYKSKIKLIKVITELKNSLKDNDPYKAELESKLSLYNVSGELYVRLEQAEETNSGLKQERSDLELELMSLKIDLNKANEEKERLEKQWQELDVKLTALEAGCDFKDRFIEEQKKKITQLENQLAEKKIEIVTLQGQLEKFNEEKDTAKEETNLQLQVQLAAAEERKEELETQLATAEKQQKTLQAQLEDAKKEKEKLESQFTETDKTNAQLQAELAALRKAAKALEEARTKRRYAGMATSIFIVFVLVLWAAEDPDLFKKIFKKFLP